MTGDGRTKGWHGITSDKKHVPWSQVSGFELRLAAHQLCDVRQIVWPP